MTFQAKLREEHTRVEARMHTGGKLRFYIGMGWQGFNLPANNRNGYDSPEKALAASRRCEKRDPRFWPIAMNSGRWFPTLGEK
jgi:hypothetical protein